jgi:hypothetical protein
MNSKLKILLEFGGVLGIVCWKTLGKSDYNKVYFIIFRAKVCKILILSGFLLSNAVPEGTEQGMKSLVEDHVSSDRPRFLTD